QEPFYHDDLNYKIRYRRTSTESINEQVNKDIDRAIEDLKYAKEKADKYTDFVYSLIEDTLLRGLNFRRGICANNNIPYKSFKTRKDATIQFVIGVPKGSQNNLSFLKSIPKEYFMDSGNVAVAFKRDIDKVLSNGAQLQIGKIQTPKDVTIKVSDNGKVAVISIDIDLDVNFTSVAVSRFKIPIPSNVNFFDFSNKPNLQYREFDGSEFSMTDGASVLGQNFNDVRWYRINRYPDNDWQFTSYQLLKNQFIRADRIITRTIKTDLDGELVGTTPIPFNKRRVPSEDLEVGKERLKQKGEEGAKKFDGTIVRYPKDQIIEYGVRKTVVKTETKDIPFKEIRRPADDLEEGKTRVVQNGQVGKQTRKSTTVVNSETGKTISGPTYTNWTTTTQPKDKIIEYGVRKTVVKTETKDIPFKEIRRPADDLEEGKTRVVQNGQVGKQTRKSTTVVNSETGKTISGPTYTNWTTTTQPKDKIIEYGVRKTVVKTETKDIPFKEIRRPADDLEEGKTRVVQNGQVGKQTRKSTTVVNSETGKTISGPTYTNWTTTTQPKDKIIEYGVRKTVVKTETKDIPFKEIRRPADDLEEGKTRVVQEGQVGKQTRKSTTVVNSETGKTISGPTYTNWTTTTQPKDRIIEYGRGADIPSTGTTGMLMPLTGGIVLLGYSILSRRKNFK
ncbi:G5 domain-containing protein, partial (plasmid) [Finegoldia magna]|uniref:G5 domain-containing protein n=1 Tax=Finegoldia magna TaxID=1260 RepID=UPI00370D4C1E